MVERCRSSEARGHPSAAVTGVLFATARLQATAKRRAATWAAGRNGLRREWVAHGYLPECLHLIFIVIDPEVQARKPVVGVPD